VYEPLGTFLLRAPLLPERALGDVRALERHPLGPAAIALASESLAGAAHSEKRARALGRYARRAAFRPTPQGLLAGVCVGELGSRLAIATGRAEEARLAPTWARLAALGRALLDDADVRARVRLRAAPSLAYGPGGARWTGPGEPFGEAHEAELDARLARVLGATAQFAPWPSVRRALGGDPHDADELLLLMIDRGLLHADVTPPLVGPPPVAWMRARLAALGLSDLAGRLDRARGDLDAGDLDAGERALAALPGAGAARAVHAVLALRPPRLPELPRAAIERAARLAPLLLRLQEALAPPALERAAEPALLDAAGAASELCGEGALDLGLLEAGAYGVEPEAGEPPRQPGPATARLLPVLIDAVVRAAAAGADEAALDPGALEAALDGDGAWDSSRPASCELFLAPARAVRGAPPGTGWLLGLHGPAGASWGRFAAALGTPLARALAELADAERAARPFEERLDVAFAPAPELADLCVHPPVRARTLALSGWSDGAERTRDVTAAELELVAGAGEPSLRARAGGAPLVPSPLQRVRSTTAPPGLPRLLVAWSLQRQHAPWALAAGPLAALESAPRLTLDGFVVAPQSWRIPDDLQTGRVRAREIARWRRAARVPRLVQVGEEDQLLPVDLDAPDAAADLRGQARAFEIWPPLGRSADRDGRRVEAVVALVDRPDLAGAVALEAAARRVASARRVAPPHEAPPLPGWRTFKLHGPAERQDELLLAAFAGAVRPALRAREIAAWFFVRYVEGPGRRPHLRLRVRHATGRARAAFEARLETALAPLRAAGALAGVEIAGYTPERARWGGSPAELDAVHAVFESDSALACALVAGGARDPAPDRFVRLVGSLDALARGLGLDLAARHRLARASRDAEERLAAAGHGDGEDRAERDRAFRHLARDLRAALARPGRGAHAAHAARTARATARLPADARAALAPALLHLACVRLAGPDRDAELAAYTFWERALEGLLRAPLRAR
jgi:thiopeptide-type bacteriocin biosynthesis protein